jgi:hypothetical protein
MQTGTGVSAGVSAGWGAGRWARENGTPWEGTIFPGTGSRSSWIYGDTCSVSKVLVEPSVLDGSSIDVALWSVSVAAGPSEF